MTATLSTRLEIPELGEGEIEVSVDYKYAPSTREVLIEGCYAEIEYPPQNLSDDVSGASIPCWQMLTPLQREIIEERCREDYRERMSGAVQDNYAFRRAAEFLDE